MTEKKCFVICPIGPENSNIRLRSDDVFSNLISPIAKEFGYTTFRTIDNGLSGEINAEIITLLHESELVVADLSTLNPNVLYEIAIRHYTGLPFIQMINDYRDIPFDFNQNYTVLIREEGFGSRLKTENDLRRQFDIIQNGEQKTDTPLSRYREKIQIQKSGNTESLKIFEIQQQLDEIKRDISKLYTPSTGYPSPYAARLVANYPDVLDNFIAGATTRHFDSAAQGTSLPPVPPYSEDRSREYRHTILHNDTPKPAIRGADEDSTSNPSE